MRFEDDRYNSTLIVNCCYPSVCVTFQQVCRHPDKRVQDLKSRSESVIIEGFVSYREVITRRSFFVLEFRFEAATTNHLRLRLQLLVAVDTC